MGTIYPISPSSSQFVLQAGDLVRLENLGTAIIESTDMIDGVEHGYGYVGNTKFEWNGRTGKVTSGRAYAGYHIFGGIGRWQD